MDRELRYEIGELMQVAYSLISESTQERNQEVILSLYSEGEFAGEQWTNNIIWRQLLRIPLIFRTEESQQFVEKWDKQFEPSVSAPNVKSQIDEWGVTSISEKDLARLSNSSLLYLFNYYDNNPTKSKWGLEDVFGARRSTQQVFEECCAKNPLHYLPLAPIIFQEDLHIGYLESLLGGIAKHIEYHEGTIRHASNNWKAVEPLPDCEILSQKLLELVERYYNWLGTITVVNALKACCSVLTESLLTERLTFLLFQLKQNEDSADNFDVSKSSDDSHKLESISLGSIRGIAAKSTIILCNSMLERGYELPELLKPLMRHFARDSNMGVRCSLLNGLPWLMHKDHSFGWQLFNDIFRESQKDLWKHVERCFYYQYKQNFSLVRPYLQRLHDEAIDIAGSTWSRIATLACLAGHISADIIFDTLERVNSDDLWKGAAQVFTANISSHEHRQVCEASLITILQRDSVSEKVINVIERVFGKETSNNAISLELASIFLKNIHKNSQRCELYHFLEWFSLLASQNPISALELGEALATELEKMDPPCQIWRTKPLIVGLLSILREADETDSADLIKRAIALQDRFLRMSIREIDKIFELSSAEL